MNASRASTLLLCAAACGVGEITGVPPDFGPAPPDARVAAVDAPLVAIADAAPRSDAALGPDGGPLGRFILTYYYVAAENDFIDSGPADTTLYQPNCSELATVPAKYAHAVVIEGTGQLSDGRVFNYTGSCPCAFSPCFRFVDAAHPWGSGYGGVALEPFRSIAVDTAVLTIGHWYYVQEFDGVTMPGAAPSGGFVHDGCLRADDTGGNIIGQHIDFFSALREYYLTLDRQLGLTHVTLYDGAGRCP
jgi:3D (Asp-Asp-Asp) domain-containing protein